jgi:hypothetical protein
MREQIISILISISIFATTIPSCIHAIDVTTPLEGGWIEEVNGVTILHVEGTYYEMGYQHGYFLKQYIRENIRAFLSGFEHFGWAYDDILEVWHVQEHYLPDIYKREMRGMADGSGLSYETIAVHNTWMGVYNQLFTCWGASMWGNATIDGELLHMRSVDGMNMIQDPKTGSFIYENQVILIRDPIDAYASIAPIFAGDIIVIGGFNEQSVAVSELTIIADDITYHGINAGFRMRMVLDHASNGFEAISMMNSNRTDCWNFIVSDGNLPMGFAIEQSANFAYAYCWFDYVESIEPFWSIRDVVRRGNVYLTPQLAEREIGRTQYDISGLKGLFRYILGRDISYLIWIQYKAISDEIEKEYGTLTYESALELIRNVYLGKTNVMFRVLWQQNSKSARQWVGLPKTGDFAICFAENGNEPYQNAIHSFNFYELLHSNPP